jgi:hypothetical protein
MVQNFSPDDITGSQNLLAKAVLGKGKYLVSCFQNKIHVFSTNSNCPINLAVHLACLPVNQKLHQINILGYKTMVLWLLPASAYYKTIDCANTG